MRHAIADAFVDRITISDPTDPSACVEVPVSYVFEEALHDAVRAAFADAAWASVRTVELRLHPPLTQVRTLTGLPPVGARDLSPLVTHQIDRFFRPVVGTPLVAAEWISPKDRSVARAAIAELRVVELLERTLEDGGRKVRAVVPVGATSEPGPVLVTPVHSCSSE